MLLTICTPTYNRATLLIDLYRSLQCQTLLDFEWIIIDDGSSDHTESLVNSWIEERNPFKIKYFKKANGGKHTAINVGVTIAAGECFMIVDSDDFLKNNAVEEIHRCFEKLPKGRYAGIGFNKMFEDGSLVGTTFEEEYVDCTTLERRKHHIAGDKAEVFFTDIIKNYPFPVFEGERFITEALVWNRIANDGYKIRWVNKGIYVCRYQADGLSLGASTNLSFNGYTLYIKELLSYKATLFTEKIRWLGVYADTAASNQYSDKDIANLVDASLLLVKSSKTLYRLLKKWKNYRRRQTLLNDKK